MADVIAVDVGGTKLSAGLVHDNGTLSARVECSRGVDTLSFSPDSRRIARCGSDATVQIWPVRGNKRWPPEVKSDDQGLDELSTTWSKFPSDPPTHYSPL